MKPRMLPYILLALAACNHILTTPAHADFLVSQHTSPEFGAGAKRFSDTGADLGFLAKASDESVDEILIGPNGLYLVGNNLGSAVLRRFTLQGTPVDSSNTAVTLPRGLTLGWDGDLFMGSTAFDPTGITGVARFNPTTLAFLGNAIPYAASTGYAIVDVAFGPDDRMYVASPTAVWRYNRNNITGAIARDNSYSVPVTGNPGQTQTVHLGFRPGDSSLYSSGNQSLQIDQYDPAGNFLRTLIAPGAAGIGQIDGFSFGSDGYLYVSNGIVAFPAGGRVDRFDPISGAHIDTLAAPHYILGGITVMVPEPASLGILALGAASITLLRRRTRN